jgi:hypothetical protein
MTFALERDSTLASGLAGLGFTSDFLFVTGAFAFDTGVATLDKGFALGVATAAVLLLAATLPAVFSTFSPGDASVVLPAVLTAFFSTGFVVFAAALLALVAGSVLDDFAGFFIAFAMG